MSDNVQVELKRRTFVRLQKLAEPLVDSIDTVVERLLNAQEPSGAVPPTISGTGVAPNRDFDPASPPNLTHTKLLSASLNGRSIQPPTWNALVIEAVREAKLHAKTAENLKRLLIIPCCVGRKHDEGYKFIPEVGLSIQGQDANSAWKAAFHIAKQIGATIKAEFLWRHKDGAAFPGETATLSA